MAEAVVLEFDQAFWTAFAKVPAALAKTLRSGLLRYMKMFVSPGGDWQRAYLRGRPGVARRTGNLARAFSAVDASTSSGDIQGVGARAFTTSRYARIHELGGTIKPKRGSVRRFRKKDGTYVERRYLLLTWKSGTGRNARWYSKREVTIPARLNFFQSFKRDEGGRQRMLENAIARALGEALPHKGGSSRVPQGPAEGPAVA